MQSTKFENSIHVFGEQIAVKFAPAGAQGVIEAYASTFNDAPDSYGDVIAPGAFTKSLADHRSNGTAPAMLWSHDQRQPIGKWIELKEDGSGLRVTGKLTLAVAQAEEAFALAKDGALSLSIGYRVVASQPMTGAARLLKVLDLVEISMVAIPANTSARILSVKSTVEAAGIKDPRAFEKFLRDAGFPRVFAKDIVARGFKAAAGLRDAEDNAVSELVRSIRSSTSQLLPFTKD
jgi:HK97 family phage prohead protease